jgi:hypothetical protein
MYVVNAVSVRNAKAFFSATTVTNNNARFAAKVNPYFSLYIRGI